MEFKYAPMFQLGEDKTEYYKIPGSEKLVSTSEFEGKKIDFEDEEAFRVVKGGAPAGKENAVDAISGASITSHALGVSIDNWLQAYKPFLKAAAAKAVQPSEVENAADSLCVSADSLAIAK